MKRLFRQNWQWSSCE